MKKSILLICFAMFSVLSYGQIIDGMTQPLKYRIIVQAPTNLEKNTSSVTLIAGYRFDAQPFTFTPVLTYNMNTEEFSPQLWANFHVKNKLHVLSRTFYLSKANVFRETLSGSYNIRSGLFLSFTWFDMINESNIDKSRLQVVADYKFWKLIFNFGYAAINNNGFVSNLRINVTDYTRLQIKYDTGLKTLMFSAHFEFKSK